MTSTQGIDRREAIRRTALLMGTAVSAPTMLGIMQGCAPSFEIDWQPILLSEDQIKTVTAMVDVILPSGETPGALDVGIPQFVDSMVGEVYDPDAKKVFVDGLVGFMERMTTDNGDAFEDLDPQAQFEIIGGLNDEIVGMSHAPADPGQEALGQDKKSFFRFLKELTVIGYCRSEAGATQLLKYDKIPGEYKGCIPYSEVGGQWAT